MRARKKRSRLVEGQKKTKNTTEGQEKKKDATEGQETKKNNGRAQLFWLVWSTPVFKSKTYVSHWF